MAFAEKPDSFVYTFVLSQRSTEQNRTGNGSLLERGVVGEGDGCDCGETGHLVQGGLRVGQTAGRRSRRSYNTIRVDLGCI